MGAHSFKMQQDKHDDVAIEVNKLLTGNHFVQCPSCGAPSVHYWNHACHTLTCTCGTQYCGICGTESAQHNVISQTMRDSADPDAYFRGRNHKQQLCAIFQTNLATF